MKKNYALASAFLFLGISSSFGQAPFMKNTFTYAAGEKYASQAISTYDNRKITDDMDREVYYFENFDDGFGGWIEEIQDGPVGFKLTNTGHENDAENTFQIPVLTTSTPTQWVLLDSDADNSSYAISEAATLTSPMLDLSAATGSFVALTFEQFFAEWQPAETEDHCFLGISTDGLLWTEVEINEGAGREARPNPEYVSWDITDLIAGDESTVWFRFRWDGAWNYGWQIDNIRVEDINEKDLTVLNTYRAYDGGIVYSQVAEAHAQEFIIGAVMRNIGHIEQTNVGFDYVIYGPGGTEVASGTSSDVIASLLNGEQDTVLHATGFTPTELGNYTVEWTAISSEGDDDMADNTKSDDHFMLTPYTMALDYNGGPVIETLNWPLKDGEAYFGNLMTFQTNDVATAMQVKIANNPEIAGEVIKPAIWEFFEGATEWALVYDGADYSITEGDINNMITFDLEEFDVVTTSTYMFCSYQYSNGPAPIFVRQGDIGFNNVQGKDDEFANRGFFDRAAPIVRVRLNAGEVGIEEEAKQAFFSIYPNPAADVLTATFGFTESSNATLSILDISGKVVRTVKVVVVENTANVTLQLNDLTAGVYFVELRNAEGKQVKKFVKK